MADPALHRETQPLKQIAIDYTPEVCTHCLNSNTITLTFDHRGGARWRTTTRFLYGTSAPHSVPHWQHQRPQHQPNYYTTGTGNRESIHQLGFACSDGFHEYVIKWGPDLIEWLIDGKAERRDGEDFPQKPMFLFASGWYASYIDEGRWTGKYVGCDAPYVCVYKDIRVPAGTALECSSDS